MRKKKLWKVMNCLRSEFKRTGMPLALFVTPPAVLMMRDKPFTAWPISKALRFRRVQSAAAI